MSDKRPFNELLAQESPSGESLPKESQVAPGPVIFFDGDCAFCNRFVRIVLRLDSSQSFYFAPLQGATAQGVLPPQLRSDLETLVVHLPEGENLLRSDAVLFILGRCRKPYAALSLFRVMPRSLRDFFYGVVAKHRHSLFPPQHSCSLPQPGEKERFLP